MLELIESEFDQMMETILQFICCYQPEKKEEPNDVSKNKQPLIELDELNKVD